MIPYSSGTEAWLAAIVEHSDDAIVSKDLNGIVQTWNKAAERIFGYSASEIVGRPITLIIPVERLPEEDEVLRRIRSGQLVDHFQTVRQTKDKRLVDISLTISPVRDSTGKIIGASKIARDITEQKRLERAAAEANRLKDEFLAVLSHELRTPLNTVMGYVHLLQQPDLPADMKGKALDAIVRNTDALTHLVNDVLDTSRIVTGKLRLTLAPVSLPSIIRDAIDTVRPAVDAKNIVLTEEMPSDLEMLADGDRLRQVVWNLLLNAVKFTPAGGRISIKAAVDGLYARIEVSDTGVGIDPNHLSLIFQRFWQAESGLSKGSGLGLGLALSRHIVELHGGAITAASGGLGHGATFIVQLPIVGVRTADSIS